MGEDLLNSYITTKKKFLQKNKVNAFRRAYERRISLENNLGKCKKIRPFMRKGSTQENNKSG